MNRDTVRKVAQTRAKERRLPWDDSSVTVTRPVLGRLRGQWRLTSQVAALGADATVIMVLDETTGEIARFSARNLRATAVIHLEPAGSRVAGWQVVASSVALGLVTMLLLYAASDAVAIPMVLAVALAGAGGCVMTVFVLGLWVRRELRPAVEQPDAADEARASSAVRRGPRS